MKLNFDANQEYQLRAIESIVNIFEGQPLNQGDFEFSMSGSGGLPLLVKGVRNRSEEHTSELQSH